MGGSASLLAAVAAPQRVAGLVLIDPPMIPFELAREALAMGIKTANPMADGAARRRADFPDVTSARDRWRADHLGYIFQQFNLLPYLSVLDNVRLPLRFSRRRATRSAANGADSAEMLLERSGLSAGLWRQPAGALSVGQQQRVAAARALIGAPELVVADEPTSALDEDLRESFMALLLERCTATRSALLFVSHDLRLAARFDRVIDLPSLNRAATDLNNAEVSR